MASSFAADAAFVRAERLLDGGAVAQNVSVFAARERGGTRGPAVLEQGDRGSDPEDPLRHVG